MTNQVVWDPFADEVTIDENGISSQSYSVNKRSSKSIELVCELIDTFPQVLLPPFPIMKSWKIIDKTLKNNSNYPQTTITVDVSSNISNEVLEYLGIDKAGVNAKNSHCLKFQMESKDIIIKIYEQISKYELPARVPKNKSYISPEIGRHLNGGSLTSLRDIYFYTELSQKELEDFFLLNIPFWGGGPKIYGVLFDLEKNKILKLKQYIYPNGDVSLELPPPHITDY